MARKTAFKREPLSDLEDLRDDCVAVVLNSGNNFKQVHEKGGPTPTTISKWLYKETMFPQLATVRAMLNACGHEITIAPKGSSRIQRINPEGDEHVEMPVKTTPRVSMLTRSKRSSAMIKGSPALAKVQARSKARKDARKGNSK